MLYGTGSVTHPQQQRTFLGNRVMCPRAEALPIDLVWKVINQSYSLESHISNAATLGDGSSPAPGKDQALKDKLQALSFFISCWQTKTSGLRVVLSKGLSCVPGQARAQGWLPGAAGEEGTILPGGNWPGDPGQRQHLSLCTRLRWKGGRWCRLVSPLQGKQKPSYFIKPQWVVLWWSVMFPMECSFRTWVDTNSASSTSFPNRGMQWHLTQHKPTLLLSSSEIKLWKGGQNLEHCW